MPVPRFHGFTAAHLWHLPQLCFVLVSYDIMQHFPRSLCRVLVGTCGFPGAVTDFIFIYTRFLALGTTNSPFLPMSLPTFEANTVSDDILPEILKDESTTIPVTPVTAQCGDEPVVTRRELWSYFCVYHCTIVDFFVAISLTSSLQYITLGTTYALPISVCYPDHEVLVLILDSCVQCTGPRTRR
jgi:hypothetical protein